MKLPKSWLAELVADVAFGEFCLVQAGARVGDG